MLPLALPSRGLRKRQNLKSSEPISVLFLASQSHKRFYLQVGDLLFYIPFMYRLISSCSDLWHLNRKDAYEKQRESRRDPNMPPGPQQGKSEMTILPQKPISKRGKSLVPPTAPAASMPQRQPLRRIWQGDVGWMVPERAVSCTDGCSQHNPPHSREDKWSGISDEPQQYRFSHDSPDSTFHPCTSLT